MYTLIGCRCLVCAVLLQAWKDSKSRDLALATMAREFLACDEARALMVKVASCAALRVVDLERLEGALRALDRSQ